MQGLNRHTKETLSERHARKKHKCLTKPRIPMIAYFGSDNIYKTLIEDTKCSTNYVHRNQMQKDQRVLANFRPARDHSEMFCNFL